MEDLGSQASRCPFCGEDLREETHIIAGKTFKVLCSCACEGASQADAEKEANATIQAKTMAIHSGLLSAGVPLLFEKCFVSDEEYDKFMPESIERKMGLYITGAVGAGKTYKACAYLRKYAHRHLKELVDGVYICPQLEFVSSEKMYQLFRSQLNNKSTLEWVDIENVFKTVELLCIDDIGKEKPSEWTVEKLFSIVNTRYENMLPTIYTSNYSITELGKRLSVSGNPQTANAIVSRIVETTKQINVGNIDRRKL